MWWLGIVSPAVTKLQDQIHSGRDLRAKMLQAVYPKSVVQV